MINPHKWLFTPMDCSCVWTRRPEELFRAFSADPEYMPDRDTTVTDLKDYGPALGRRFRGLKLWAVLSWYGREGLQELIREHVRLAQLFASWIEETPGWEVVGRHDFSVVCFRREGSDEENEALVQRINASGEAFLSAHAAQRPFRPAPRRSATRAPPKETSRASGSCSARTRSSPRTCRRRPGLPFS